MLEKKSRYDFSVTIFFRHIYSKNVEAYPGNNLKQQATKTRTLLYACEINLVETQRFSRISFIQQTYLHLSSGCVRLDEKFNLYLCL